MAFSLNPIYYLLIPHSPSVGENSYPGVPVSLLAGRLQSGVQGPVSSCLYNLLVLWFLRLHVPNFSLRARNLLARGAGLLGE